MYFLPIPQPKNTVMNNYFLTQDQVEARQKFWGLPTTYLNDLPESRAHWISKITEKALEISLESYASQAYYDQVVDLIIFSQNFSATLDRKISLVIFTTYGSTFDEYLAAILYLQKCTESTYLFENWFKSFIALLDIDYQDIQKIEQAYQKKTSVSINHKSECKSCQTKFAEYCPKICTNCGCMSFKAHNPSDWLID